ncbi:hypothetical protein EsH8_I_000211 [Colletotrichum jinshuiense]
MKAAQILAILGFTSATLAQTLAPSPTASIGCEPHGDHWHCEGPRETGAAVSSAVTSAPAGTTLTTAVAATTTATEDHDHDEDDHDHSAGTASLAPSPTESIGCLPHGDHWHCEGPASAASTEAGTASTTNAAATTTSAAASSAAASNSTQPTTSAVPAGAARAGFGVAAIAAALMAL